MLGVRSGVIYHSCQGQELTFVEAFCTSIVIASPCLFEDTNKYNYVRTPHSYILPASQRQTTGELSVCINGIDEGGYIWLYKDCNMVGKH